MKFIGNKVDPAEELNAIKDLEDDRLASRLRILDAKACADATVGGYPVNQVKANLETADLGAYLAMVPHVARVAGIVPPESIPVDPAPAIESLRGLRDRVSSYTFPGSIALNLEGLPVTDEVQAVRDATVTLQTTLQETATDALHTFYRIK